MSGLAERLRTGFHRIGVVFLALGAIGTIASAVFGAAVLVLNPTLTMSVEKSDSINADDVENWWENDPLAAPDSINADDVAKWAEFPKVGEGKMFGDLVPGNSKYIVKLSDGTAYAVLAPSGTELEQVRTKSMKDNEFRERFNSVAARRSNGWNLLSLAPLGLVGGGVLYAIVWVLGWVIRGFV